MQRLQSKFPAEFDRTSSHKFRASDDVQYAFAYFWFMMEDTARMEAEEFCARNADTDLNGIVTDNEMRTLVSVLKGGQGVVAMDLKKMHDLALNCSIEWNAAAKVSRDSREERVRKLRRGKVVADDDDDHDDDNDVVDADVDPVWRIVRRGGKMLNATCVHDP